MIGVQDLVAADLGILTDEGSASWAEGIRAGGFSDTEGMTAAGTLEGEPQWTLGRFENRTMKRADLPGFTDAGRNVSSIRRSAMSAGETASIALYRVRQGPGLSKISRRSKWSDTQAGAGATGAAWEVAGDNSRRATRASMEDP
jgi:hypothetical protein